MTARIPHPYGEDDARAWLAGLESAGNDEEVFLLEIGEHGTRAIVGSAGSMPLDENTREIGYWIGEPFWGKGYASEGARAVVGHVFARTSVSQLRARIRTDNPASGRVLEKLGFASQGDGTCSSCAAGADLPAEIFSLTRDDWMKQRGALASLFSDRTGIQWGLRGDPPLWEAMRDRLANDPLPATREDLEALVSEAFAALTGARLDSAEPVHVAAFERGGMSSGLVSPPFWRETALLLLEERWRGATGAPSTPDA